MKNTKQTTTTNKSQVLNLTAIMQYHAYEWLEEEHPALAFFLDKFEEQTIWEKPKVVIKRNSTVTNIDGVYYGNYDHNTEGVPCRLQIMKNEKGSKFVLYIKDKRIPLSYDYSLPQVVCMIMDALPIRYLDEEVLGSLADLDYSPDCPEKTLYYVEDIAPQFKETREMLGLPGPKYVLEHLYNEDLITSMALDESYRTIIADVYAWYTKNNNTKVYNHIIEALKGMLDDAAKKNNHIYEWTRNKWFATTKENVSPSIKAARKSLDDIWVSCHKDPVLFDKVVLKLYNFLVSEHHEDEPKVVVVQQPVVEEVKEVEPIKQQKPVVTDKTHNSLTGMSVYELMDWLHK